MVDPKAAANDDLVVVDPKAAANDDLVVVDPKAAANDDLVVVDPKAAANDDLVGKSHDNPLQSETNGLADALALPSHVSGGSA
ncbi:hypothetical protein [Streptomyces sp. NPDC096153]|uniref:hypothetical protein n=1 Tax=Streptomyces sp. NPDC096153 TaxID=3155548 RepID=UPI00332049B5